MSERCSFCAGKVRQAPLRWRMTLQPGDTVVVTFDEVRAGPWTAAATVIYNLIVAVPAIGNLSDRHSNERK